MAKGKAKIKQVQDSDGDYDFQTEDDARTMERHQEIVSDPDRHAKATAHLGKKAQTVGDAHKAARKQLEKKTKGRLKKAFGGKGGDKAGTFGAEKDREKGDMEQIVSQDD